jgi:hypothetical protein
MSLHDNQTGSSAGPDTTPPRDIATPSTFSAGDQVGCYVLMRHLHGGAFGQVWLGRHALLGDRCAVKVLPDSQRGHIELDGVRRYKNLADAWTGLVPVHEVGMVPGKGFYYTMPLADDVNGRAILRDPAEYEPMTLQRYREMHRPAAIDRVLAVAAHLLPSLHALHEAGLVHRDVKPANIIRVEGTWKFCDLGLLARRDEICTDSGTPWFMPPEGVKDRRADLYAFGKTLFLLATDHEAARFGEFMEGKLTIPGNDDRRAGLQEVIEIACQDELNRRFQTALEMHLAINKLVRTTKLTITLDDHFASFTQARLDEFVKAIRERGFNIQGIPVCVEGSVRITLRLAPDEAEQLAAMVEAGEFVRFRAVGVELDELAPAREVTAPAAAESFAQGARTTGAQSLGRREQLFNRIWEALAREEQTTGRPVHTVLFYRAGHQEMRSAQMAEQLSVQLGREVTADWVRKWLHVGRERFAELLLAEVAASLSDPTPDTVAEELIDLELFQYCKLALDRWRQRLSETPPA